MTRQRGTLRRLWGGAALGLAAAFSTLVLLAPTALADPQADATAAIDAAWTAAGGEQSALGAPDGDVYAAGAGFAQNFAGGAIFFTPETGARTMYGEILAKYRALGGPADSDLGFPTIDEGPGRISPESRNSIFSAPDQPVIFWTPETGAWVVRGAINAAWDATGGSSGPLGVPTAEQTRDGDVVSQTFTGGQISFDTVTRQFTTEPAELAQQLGNVAIPGEAPAPPPPAPPTEAPPAAPEAPPTDASPTEATPSPAPQDDESGGFQWQNWWLWWIIPLALLLLGALVAWFASRRRRSAGTPPGAPTPVLTESPTFDGPENRSRWVPPAHERDDEASYWLSDAPTTRTVTPDAPLYGGPQPFDDQHAGEPVSETPDVADGDFARGVAGRDVTSAAPEFELFTHRGAHAAAEDPDAVDTAPTPVQPSSWEGEVTMGRHAAADDDQPTFGGTDFRREEYAGDDFEDDDFEDYEYADYSEQRPADESVAEVVEPDTRDADEFGDGGPETAFVPEEVDDAAGEPPPLHLPLDDEHLAPEGYPVKGRMSTGTYHTPDSAGYDDVVAEIWFADAQHAEANGFVRGD